MQKVRIALPYAYCLAEYGNVGGKMTAGYQVYAAGGTFGFGLTPRSAWEKALAAMLAKALVPE